MPVPPALRRIYAFAVQTGRRNNRTKQSPRYQQRCAVRLTYVGNKTAGQWKAHGRYLARESATRRAAQRQAGFDQNPRQARCGEALNAWQLASDPRLWRSSSRMQKMADRQRTRAAGGILRCDERLPTQPLDCRAADGVEGRILVHGQEENGPSYVMLESTDAKVYTINHSRRMQQMRNAGQLQVNSFVRLRSVFAAGRAELEIDELGNAEGVLEKPRPFERNRTTVVAQRNHACGGRLGWLVRTLPTCFDYGNQGFTGGET